MVELASLVDPSTTVVLTQECQRAIIGDLGQGVLPDAARAAGISFEQMCQRLVDHAIQRRAHQVGPPTG